MRPSRLALFSLSLSLSLCLAGCASTAEKSDAPAQGRPAKEEASLAALITRSHLASAFATFPTIIRVGIADMREDGLLDPQKAGRLEAALERHWQPEAIRRRAEQHLAERLSAEEIERVGAYLSDPAVARINQLTVAANQAGGEELQAFLRSLEENPPPERRRDLCERMVRNVVSVRTARALVAVPLDAMLSLANAASPDEPMSDE